MKKFTIAVAAFLLFAPAAFASDISVKELHDRLANGDEVLLIDVREAWEHEELNLGGKLIPLGKFTEPIGELEARKDDEIVVYDRTGSRSGMAQNVLAGQGFTNVRNLTGGLLAWIEAYGRTLPKPKPNPRAASPTVQTPSSAPAAVQEKLLFKSGAADLVEEATGWLSDLIDDEDITTAITEKWSARKDLVGKTRSQILALLLADAKGVITDKAALDAFVKGWNANASPGPK